MRHKCDVGGLGMGGQGRRCIFHQPFEEYRRVHLPVDHEGPEFAGVHAGAAAHAALPVDGRLLLFQDKRSVETGRHTGSAAGALLRDEVRPQPAMLLHLAFDRGTPHGQVLQGAAKTRQEMPLEMIEGHQGIGIRNVAGDAAALEMPALGRNLPGRCPLHRPSAITTGAPIMLGSKPCRAATRAWETPFETLALVKGVGVGQKRLGAGFF